MEDITRRLLFADKIGRSSLYTEWEFPLIIIHLPSRNFRYQPSGWNLSVVTFLFTYTSSRPRKAPNSSHRTPRCHLTNIFWLNNKVVHHNTKFPCFSSSLVFYFCAWMRKEIIVWHLVCLSLTIKSRLLSYYYDLALSEF